MLFSRDNRPSWRMPICHSWIDALKLLLEPEYKGYTIVSGRGGVVTQQIVRSQIDILKRIYDRVDKIGKKKPAVPGTDKLAEQLLKDFKAPAARQKQYLHRLRYGLHHYYVRHYHPGIEADHGGTVTKPLFEVTRGRMIESVHYGSIAVVDSNGNLIASYGDPQMVAFLRSSAKPFQVLPFVERGGVEYFRIHPA